MDQLLLSLKFMCVGTRSQLTYMYTKISSRSVGIVSAHTAPVIRAGDTGYMMHASLSGQGLGEKSDFSGYEWNEADGYI